MGAIILKALASERTSLYKIISDEKQFKILKGAINSSKAGLDSYLLEKGFLAHKQKGNV